MRDFLINDVRRALRAMAARSTSTIAAMPTFVTAQRMRT